MNRDVFPCFVCDKGYKTRQALETHLFRSKKRCYSGVTPPGLDAYCLFNNRAFCTNCNLCVKNSSGSCCSLCGLGLLYSKSVANLSLSADSDLLHTVHPESRATDQTNLYNHLAEDIFYDVEISDPIDDDAVVSLTPADYIYGLQPMRA